MPEGRRPNKFAKLKNVKEVSRCSKKMTTSLKTQKRIAARVLKCGMTRVWIDPDAENEVGTAMTTGDIRKYIGLGFVKKIPITSATTARHRYKKAQRKKGRRRGHGSRTGSKKARSPKKEFWMKRIRAQRSLLQGLRSGGMIDNRQFRMLYAKLKSGMFKSKAHLLVYMKEQGVKFKKKAKKKQK